MFDVFVRNHDIFIFYYVVALCVKMFRIAPRLAQKWLARQLHAGWRSIRDSTTAGVRPATAPGVSLTAIEVSLAET